MKPKYSEMRLLVEGSFHRGGGMCRAPLLPAMELLRKKFARDVFPSSLVHTLSFEYDTMTLALAVKSSLWRRPADG